MNSVITVAKILAHVTQNIIRVSEEGMLLATRPHTQADMDKWEEDVKNVFKDTDESSLNGAKSAAKEEATKGLMDRGFSKQAADQMFEHRWEKMKSLAASARGKIEKYKPSVAKQISWTLAKAAMIFLAIGGFMHYKYGKEEPLIADGTACVTCAVKLIPVEPMQISPDQFNIMYGGLAVPSAPMPVLDAPVPVAAAALPPAVAVIADAPADAELTSEQGVTQEVQTTVGSVYRQSAPQVQRQIERAAPAIARLQQTERASEGLSRPAQKRLGIATSTS